MTHSRSRISSILLQNAATGCHRREQESCITKACCGLSRVDEQNMLRGTGKAAWDVSSVLVGVVYEVDSGGLKWV